MISEQHQKLVDWAEKWPNCADITPIILILDNREWEGIRYRQYSIGGKHVDGVPEQAERFYLLGEAPKEYRMTSKLCFVVPESPWEFFIDNVFQDKTDDFTKNLHQCGIHWSMCAWTKDEPIDKYSQREYVRLVTTLIVFHIQYGQTG